MAVNFGSCNNFQTSNYGYSSFTCILRVNARIPRWQRAMSHVLSSIRGIYNFKMAPNGLIEVSGTAHPNLILDRIWRTGMHAEIVSVQSRDRSSSLYTLRHGGQGQDYRGYGRYSIGSNGGDHGFGGEMENNTCHGRSYYGGYWNHPTRPTYNRPFAGLVESIRPPLSPRWFWH